MNIQPAAAMEDMLQNENGLVICEPILILKYIVLSSSGVVAQLVDPGDDAWEQLLCTLHKWAEGVQDGALILQTKKSV